MFGVLRCAGLEHVEAIVGFVFAYIRLVTQGDGVSEDRFQQFRDLAQLRFNFAGGCFRVGVHCLTARGFYLCRQHVWAHPAQSCTQPLYEQRLAGLVVRCLSCRRCCRLRSLRSCFCAAARADKQGPLALAQSLSSQLQEVPPHDVPARHAQRRAGAFCWSGNTRRSISLCTGLACLASLFSDQNAQSA